MAKIIEKKFLSLKWKIGLLFGLVLFILNATFPILVYWTLNHQFESSRQEVQQQYAQELLGQVQYSANERQRLIELIFLHDPRIISQQEQSLHIVNSLTQHQSDLELNWNISQAQYLNDKGLRLGGWGDTLPDSILNLLPDALNDESILSKINCTQGCKQYDLIPILGINKTTFILVISYDLTDTLLAINNKLGIDVGVLSSEPSGGYLLEQWQLKVSALTSYNDSLAKIKVLAEQYSLEDIKQTKGLIRDESQHIEAQFLTIPSSADTLFVIIDDIHQQYSKVLTTTYQSIIIALIIVAVIGGGLFFFLSGHLLRLSSISQALPLLAKQQYGAARALILPIRHNHTLDELDILESTTHNLAQQLEYLEKVLKFNADILNDRNNELRQERDFIKTLFNTTPLIIVTSDKKFNILSFNDYAEHSTGYKEKDILNKSLSQFFPSEKWDEVKSELMTISAKPHEISHQEYDFINSDGTLHIISWLHSSLEDPTGNTALLSVGIDITDKKRSEEQIIWMADHDALTSLYNRRRFGVEFEKLLSSSKRFKHQGALLFLDLDQFKDVNDSCGHTQGDNLLKQVAQTLLDTTRSTDLVSRLGGDEFAILLAETDDIGAANLAGNICQAIGAIDIIDNDIHYRVTASIGIITFPQADFSIEELIGNADLAMYQAKAKGKNTWHQFSLNDKARTQLETRLTWKRKIEHALKEEKFIFYYQPIMEISSQTVSHYEVLLRMENDDGSISYPDSFIPVAEQTGLIQAIDHYVLHRGIIKQEQLDKDNIPISLALNLSGHAFNDAVLFALLKHFITQSNVSPEHLIFEITETSAVADLNQAKETIEQLKALGCRFSIDDFGTGFASFRYMRELPVDIVKIDGSFIQHLATSHDDQLFVKALVDVAKGMGKKTVAEFVENAETLKLLEEFGVDYAQGYYIGKPEPEFLDGPPVLK